MKHRLPPLICLLLYTGAAPANLYSCVDAQGNKSVSDRACAPTQNTEKVYLAPSKSAPAAPAADAESEADARLAAQLKLLLQGMEHNAAQPAAPAAPAPPVETEEQRHTRLYLEQQQQGAPHP